MPCSTLCIINNSSSQAGKALKPEMPSHKRCRQRQPSTQLPGPLVLLHTDRAAASKHLRSGVCGCASTQAPGTIHVATCCADASVQSPLQLAALAMQHSKHACSQMPDGNCEASSCTALGAAQYRSARDLEPLPVGNSSAMHPVMRLMSAEVEAVESAEPCCSALSLPQSAPSRSATMAAACASPCETMLLTAWTYRPSCTASRRSS